MPRRRVTRRGYGMKTLRCPLNGIRNIDEFIYGGEYHVEPDRKQADRKAWAEHVFFNTNPAGVVTEWWCHTPSSFWFLADRDTVTDEVISTYPFSIDPVET